MTADLPTVHGTTAPLQELIELRAGPVTAVLDGVDLRYVRVGDAELVRRIYVAVRDRNWNTIPGVASAVAVDQRDDAFQVGFSVRHAGHDTGFAWRGSITGHADGRIRFAMDGWAERAMLFNRVGFCVLHPWRESAGRRYRGRTPAGEVEGVLPDLVAPQGFAQGAYVALFDAVSRLQIDLAEGGEVVLEFEGDLFETEDQRNWTDASLKTYCTPLALGFPHELRDGERRAQTVTVYPRGFAGPRPAAPGSAGAGPRVSVGALTGMKMPAVGLGLPAGAAVPSVPEAARLRVLGPAHVRHELHLRAQWREDLAAAAAAADALGAPLELALFVGPDAEGVDEVRDAVAGLDLARVLVAVRDAQTTSAEETTPGALVDRVRAALALGAGVPVAGGTDMYFCELNRTRPDVALMDGVFWSMNPQVHAFDDLSVMETPEAQGEQVRTARDFAAGRPLFVGPVTLRRRYNVNATATDGDARGDQLPDSVDPRQQSLLGAAWTLASLKHIAEQGAAAVTYFETVGWRGVIQGDREPPLPEAFPAAVGMAFPLFHVLTDAAELRGGALVSCECDRPLEVAAWAVARGGAELTMVLANLTPRPIVVAVDGAGTEAPLRRLNGDTAQRAMLDPESFRTSARREAVGEIGLAPYETVRIDTRGEEERWTTSRVRRRWPVACSVAR